MSQLIDRMYELMPAVYRLRDRAPAPDPKRRVQLLQFLGLAPSGGTFTLAYGADITPVLPFGAGVGDIQSALEALPGIGVGNVLVSPAESGFQIEFRGAIEANPHPALVVDGSLLTPLGSSPTVAPKTSPKVMEGLFRVLAEQADIVERDIAQLYENWFIETCDEWVAPYIGDLLGVPIQNAIDTGFSQRSQVANTLAYRRRKGTARMLEQLARDTTGWPSAAVEFFMRLDWHQNMNHIRSGNHRSPDLRDTNALELIGTAFDTANYSVDVRRIATGRGWHNIPSIGLFLWRLRAYPVVQSRAKRSGPANKARFHFDPLGREFPLFNSGGREVSIDDAATELDVPVPLRRRPLFDELNARREAIVAGRPARPMAFGANPPFQVWLGAETEPLRPEEIRVCDLSIWTRPAAEVFVRPDGSSFKIRAAVDPVLGRLMPAMGELNQPPRVAYAYGAPGDLGAGPYDRTDSLAERLQLASRPGDASLPQPTWQMGVRKDLDAGEPRIVATLQEAVDAWNGQPAGTVGVIAIMDSETYPETIANANQIQLKPGQSLFLVAADWVQTEDEFGVPQPRAVGDLAPSGLRPCIIGNLEVRGPNETDATADVTFDGLLVQGGIRAGQGSLRRLTIAHCSVHREKPTEESALTAANNQDDLEIVVLRSQLGPMRLGTGVETVRMEDAVVHSETDALTATSAHLDLDSVTLIGTVTARSMDASNAIFMGVVDCERRQTGCVRFSYLSPNSEVGRRYRCQPDLALQRFEEEKGAPPDPDEETAILDRVRPAFTTLEVGAPAHTQLHRRTAWEIAEGAEDGAEMGAWRFLKQPQRRANLRACLDEYLPFAMEAGAIEVN